MERRNLFTFSSNILMLFLLLSIIVISDIIFPRLNSNDYMQNHYQRVEIVSLTSEKKAIIFGGSSVGFSLNSNYLGSLNNEYSVINYGTHAGLSYGFKIDEILDYLNEGDLIVFALEYEYFFRDSNDEELQRYVVNLRNHNIENIIINRYLYRTNKLFSSLVYSIYNARVDQISPYKADSINEHGDLVSHYGLETSAFQPKKIEGDFNQIFFISFLTSIEELEAIGIEVIITFPPVTNEYFNLNNEKIELYYRNLLASNLNIISSPSDYIFEIGLFYDTSYHMTQNGAKGRTLKLNEDIFDYQTRKDYGAPTGHQ